MAVSGILPIINVADANGSPYVGAVLYVYEAGTTNYRAIYSDAALTVPMTNPLTGVNASDARGNFPRFFMAAGTYKLRAETSTGVLIPPEVDNIDTGTSAGSGALPIAGGGTGATTAAAARAALDVPSNSELADLADDIATFTEALQNIVSQPQGRLTPTSLTPVISSTVSAGTAVYYTPYNGNLCPVYDGVQFNLQEFAELTLALHANHVLNSIYDCFIINDGGTIRIVTGPAWSTITAGSGARGTGAGTTELTRQAGLWVNANAMATARNGATTYAVAAKCGTYVGSLYIDGTAGQITCNVASGQSRKWGVWNAYNRVPIVLLATDPTASWTSAPTTWRQSRADATNFAMGFAGLPESTIFAEFQQLLVTQTNNTTSQAQIGIGLNVTNALSGTKGEHFGNTNTASVIIFGASVVAKYNLPPTIGVNAFNTLEQAPSGTTNNTYAGTIDNMRLSVRWFG